MVNDLELARRAVACRRWRWMPGMRYRLTPNHPWCRYEGVDACDDDGNLVTESVPTTRSTFATPDTTDPATLGCLIAMVREAWGKPEFYMTRSDPRTDWALGSHDSDEVLGYVSGDTESEALVAALEAAP